MAKAKKNDKSYKKSRAYKHARPVHRVLKSRLAIVAIVLAALGVVAIFAFRDTPSQAKIKPRKKGNLSISYVKEKPEIIERNAQGAPVYTSRSREVSVSAEGNLFCTPEDSNQVTTRQLSSTELKNLRASIKATKADQQADDISGDKVHVNSYRGLNITNDDGSRKRTYVYKPDLETPQFKKAVTTMEALCASATTPVPNSDVPSWDPTISRSDSLVGRLASLFIPKAYAQAPNDVGAEGVQKAEIDKFRTARGLPKFVRSTCVDKAARGWAYMMGVQNKLYHSAQAQLVHANGCGDNWDSLGENVGWAGGGDVAAVSLAIFNAFVNSPVHNQAMANPGFNVVGIGAYYDAPSQRLWISQLFVGCRSDLCVNTTTYIKKSSL